MKLNQLLRDRRFGPLFYTQFFGAFNDNFFKNALIILITFRLAESLGISGGILVALSAGVFILPFFLFSATSGQLADKYEKSVLIRGVKFLEIIVMIFACVGFFIQSTWMLIVTLFFMGFQSALFGPLKYGILPQLLEDHELVGGNGLIEMGTFLAILLGTLLGGLIVPLDPWGPEIVGGGLIFIALLGFTSSFSIPKAPSLDPEIKVNWNFLTQTWRLCVYAQKNRTVFLSILGVSWFWFFGGTILTILPDYCKVVLGGNEQIVTLFLTIFSVGIGLGSVFCDKLSGDKVELGLVPFGTFGMTFFMLDLFWASWAFPSSFSSGVEVGFLEFLQTFRGIRISVDLLLISVFAGFFIVPLYALVQQRSEGSHVSRVIAAMNIINALFMVVSALMMMGLFKLNFPLVWVFFLLAVFNFLVSVYIFNLIPEFLLRFMVWILVHSVYRLKPVGSENIPDQGPAVMVCNHISFVDALIIASASRRPIRFIMDEQFLSLPFLRYFFEKSKVIPIASLKDNPKTLKNAFEEISASLKRGELVCIFPEGRLSPDGKIHEFRSGIEKIIERDPVPVVPVALQGLWHSYFSRRFGKAMRGLPKRIWFPIGLKFGPAIPAEDAKAKLLFEKVSALRGDWA